MSRNFKIIDEDDNSLIGTNEFYQIRSNKQVEAAKKYSKGREEYIKALEMLADYKGKKNITCEDVENMIDVEETAKEEKKKSGKYTQYFRKLISENPANVARFFYMCTFLDFGSEHLMLNGRYMTKKDLKRVMKLKEDAFLEFYNEMIDNNIIYEDGIFIKVNPEYSIRGKSHMKSLAIIRCFDIPIKKIFEATTPRKHKHIGYILMLLPYMNKYSNFLCKITNENNDDELKTTIYNKNINDVVYLSMKDICEMIGYDVSNMSRLRRELCSIKVDDEYLFAFVLRGDNEYYPIINDVFFFGSDWYRKSLLHNTLFSAKKD